MTPQSTLKTTPKANHNKKQGSKSAKASPSTLVATYSGRGNQTIVRKSNDLIQNAMYSLSLSQQKLMLHIFAMIKPSDTELPRYEMSIYEFLKLCGVDPHNGSMYKQVKKNIEDIANAKVQWIRLAGTQKITMFRWLSSATIDEGTGKIVLTLDQSLKPHLIQLKEFYTTMNITYTLPMKSQYSLKIYELCKSYQNLYITKKEKGEPLVWNIETLKKQVDCNAANWAHVRRTVLDKAKSEINGHTDIYFDYEVYEKDRQRVIAIAVTIEPVDKQVADDKLNEITKSMSNRVRSKKGKLTLAETGTLDDDPNVLTLEYVSVPETTIPYSYGATPELLRQELEIKAEPDKLIRELTADEMDAVRTIIDAMVKMAGTPRGNDKMIDGGNATFFQTMNNVIDNCGAGSRESPPATPPRSSRWHAPRALPCPTCPAQFWRTWKIIVSTSQAVCRRRWRTTTVHPRRRTSSRPPTLWRPTPSRSTSWCRRMPRRRKRSRRRCCATLTATRSRPG